MKCSIIFRFIGKIDQKYFVQDKLSIFHFKIDFVTFLAQR